MGTGGLREQGGDDVPAPGGTFDSIADFSSSNQGDLNIRKVQHTDQTDLEGLSDEEQGALMHTYFDVLGTEEEPLTLDAEVNFSDREILVIPHGAQLILKAGCRLNFTQNDTIIERQLPIIKVAGELIIEEGAQINVEVVQARIGLQVLGNGHIRLKGGIININKEDDSQKIQGKGIELRRGEEEDTSNEPGNFTFTSGKINIGTIDTEGQNGIHLNTPDLGAGLGSNFTIEGDEHCEINIDSVSSGSNGIFVNNGSFNITNSNPETKISIDQIDRAVGISLRGKNTTEGEGGFTLDINGTHFSTNKLILFSEIIGGSGIFLGDFSRFTLKEGDSSKIEFEDISGNAFSRGIYCFGNQVEFIQETNSHIIIHKLFGFSNIGLLLGDSASFTMGDEGNGNGAVFEINECTNSQMIHLTEENVRLIKHKDAVIKYNGLGDTNGANGIFCEDPGTTNILVENHGGKHTIDMSLVPVFGNMYIPQLNHLDNQKGLTPPWGDAPSSSDAIIERYKVFPISI